MPKPDTGDLIYCSDYDHAVVNAGTHIADIPEYADCFWWEDTRGDNWLDHTCPVPPFCVDHRWEMMDMTASHFSETVIILRKHA